MKIVPAHAIGGADIGETVGIWGFEPRGSFPNFLDALSRNPFVYGLKFVPAYMLAVGGDDDLNVGVMV